MKIVEDIPLRSPDPTLERGENVVHASLQRLAYELSQARPQLSDSALQELSVDDMNKVLVPETPAEACLAPLLLLMGWSGELRRIREALPHFDRVRNVASLRVVLAHLGHVTVDAKHNLRKLPADSFPCVVSEKNDQVWLVAERDEDGKLLVFDGRAQQWRHASPRSIRGKAFSVRSGSGDLDRQTERSGASWLSSVVLRFSASITIAFFLSLAISLAALAVPLFVMQVYDLGIGSRSSEMIVLLATGAGMIITADLLLRHLRARVLAYVGARWDALIAISTFQKIIRLPLHQIEGAPIASQLARLRQFESMRETFTSALVSTIVDVPFALVFLAAIAYWGGHLVWIAVGLVGLFLSMALVAMPFLRNCSNAAATARQRLQRLFLEIATKQQTIRDLGAESTFVMRHREVLDEWVETNRRCHVLQGVMQTSAQSLVQLAGIGTIALGAIWVMNGAMTPGALIGVMALVWRVLSPVQATYLSASRIQLAAESVKQIDRLMNMPGESLQRSGQSFHRNFRGNIEINRLVLRYPRRTEPALRNFSLSIGAGEVIAITGPSGAGKSTLLKALVGLYAPAAGAILIDGLDLRQIDPSEWRSRIAFLPAQFDFFYGTVAQNLRLARPDASESDMLQALQDVGMGTDHPLLRDGLETRLGSDRLEHIPIAMKQSLALARCFVQPAQIYLLDNPGANIDESGTVRLERKLREIRSRATVIFSTFRPAYMRLADRVVILNEGQMVGEGPPEQVIARLSAAA